MRHVIKQQQFDSRTASRYPNARIIVHYRNETDYQKRLVKKAALAQSRLLFVVNALRRLLLDQHFVVVLQKEGDQTIPSVLVERIEARERILAVAPTRLGKAIRRRRGVCNAVVELFGNSEINPTTFRVLQEMKPSRQIEAARLMSLSANYTACYASALLAATKQVDLAIPRRTKKVGGMTPEQMARMEREMESLQKDFMAADKSHGTVVMTLVIAIGYVSKLIGNKTIENYLAQHHSEILEEFKAIVSAASLNPPPIETSVDRLS